MHILFPVVLSYLGNEDGLGVLGFDGLHSGNGVRGESVRSSGVSVRCGSVVRVDGVVGHGDGREDALDDGGDGGVGVALNGGVSEVASQAVGLDDGAVVSRSADQSGGGDKGMGGSQADQEDGDLSFKNRVEKYLLYEKEFRARKK